MTPDCLTKVKIWKSCFHRTNDICTDVFWNKKLNKILQSIYCFFFPNLQVIVKYLKWTFVIRYFLLFNIYLSIQKAISVMLRILIPVNNPKMPPKMINLFICTSNRLCIFIMYHACYHACIMYMFLQLLNSPNPDSLSKKLNLLLLTVTDIVFVVSLKVTSAWYLIFSLHISLGSSVELKAKNSILFKSCGGIGSL